MFCICLRLLTFLLRSPACAFVLRLFTFACICLCLFALACIPFIYGAVCACVRVFVYFAADSRVPGRQTLRAQRFETFSLLMPGPVALMFASIRCAPFVTDRKTLRVCSEIVEGFYVCVSDTAC